MYFKTYQIGKFMQLPITISQLKIREFSDAKFWRKYAKHPNRNRSFDKSLETYKRLHLFRLSLKTNTG